MGLHNTPAGQFYVQHSLRTGEILQILPVKREEPPSSLPSVGDLGITETFIERRRITLAADEALASGPQDRLQRELASAGGERLLQTGKAALAGTAAADSSAKNSSTHTPSSSTSMDENTLPVCSRPDSSLNRRNQQAVNLPSFRELEAARHEEEQSSCRLPQLQTQLQDQRQNHHLPPLVSLSLGGDRKRSAAESPRGRRFRSCSRSGGDDGSGSSRSPSLSMSTQVGNLAISGNHQQPQHHLTTPPTTAFVPSTASSFSSCFSSFPASVASSSSSSTSSSPPPASSPASTVTTSPTPSSSSSSLLPPKKNKTVWIIRTLEPRRVDSNDGDEETYEPQRVQTHVETHVM